MRILIVAMLLTSTAFGQVVTPAQGPPPTNLERRADGRFSANSDPANPENFEVHNVVAGDTLSAIAGRVLNNPRLWPQLWEQNDHIVNPHWIYPNDKILIRPITLITEAVPPPPPDPAPAPVVETPAPRPPVLTAVPIQAEQPPVVEDLFVLTPPRAVPQIKVGDLYCSGFVTTQQIADTVKVVSRFQADGGALATEMDYIYLGQGSEGGVNVGDMFQVVRPTKKITSPSRPASERDRGMHYLEVAQIRVIVSQARFSLARVVHSCDAIELGDYMIPFRRIDIPPIPRPRSFSPFMTASGQARGAVIATLGALANFGTAFRGSDTIPGARSGSLAPLERGLATEGTITYLDIGQADGLRVGDVMIVYREAQLDRRYDLPEEAERLEGHRTAIGELIVLKVGERASTALVTYSADAISLGDSVERR